jgi:hypothetical protein
VAEWSVAEAERILGAALARPAGAELVFGALADLPGVEHQPARKGGFLRSAEPARLSAHDWSFSTTGSGGAIEVGHRVRGIVLSRAKLPPAEAGAKLAAAVLDAAAEQGPEAQDRAAAAIGALGEVLGL